MKGELIKRKAQGITVLLAVLLVCCYTATAQTGGIDSDPGDLGTGGNNAIQGTVYGPSGQRLNQRVKVRLLSIGFGEKFAFSDDSGVFIFRRLRAGRYTLTVEGGEQFATTQEPIELIQPALRRGEGITLQVQITLRERAQTNTRAGVVNVNLAGIPEAAAKLYLQAVSIAETKPKEALELLSQALSKFPEFPKALAWQGWLQMQQNEPRKAEESLLKASTLAPELYEARLFFGILLVKQRKFEPSVKELTAALAANKESVVAKVYLGRALLGAGDLAQAETVLLEAIKTNSKESSIAHRFLGALYNERGQNTKAVEHLEQYLNLVPQDKDATQIRAIIKDLKEKSPK